VGIPFFPGQTPRSLGLFCAVAGVLVLLGGLVQINPIWLWGPFHTAVSTNGAQPDWYLGWLIGALRLMPGFDVTIGDRTIVPNPFWGGAALPSAIFGLLFLWPLLERRATGDRGFHNLLQRPRDAPVRTAIGTALVTFVAIVLLAGSADRADVLLGLSYHLQVQAYRVLVLVAPVVAGVLAYVVCRELRRGEEVERERHAAEADARSAEARSEAV
jgi:ubiquinol-cytochrome c reductase cytochrome b subunit